MPPEYVLRARDRFVAWLRWYMATYPEEAANPAALARRLDIRKSTLHEIMAPGSTRSPSFATLLAAEKVTGMSVVVLLHSDPPSVPKK